MNETRANQVGPNRRDPQVGPDGTGSYRYKLGVMFSADKYANAQSALTAARRPQVCFADGLHPIPGTGE